MQLYFVVVLEDSYELTSSICLLCPTLSSLHAISACFPSIITSYLVSVEEKKGKKLNTIGESVHFPFGLPVNCVYSRITLSILVSICLS